MNELTALKSEFDFLKEPSNHPLQQAIHDLHKVRSTSSKAEPGSGPAGAGHFVKMVHNGIEYGLMQAYAEGFEILKDANADALPVQHRLKLDLADIAEVWRRGSVIPSWLLDLTASALVIDDTLDGYSGFVEDSGEGRWTVNAAIDEAVPAQVLTATLFARFRSRNCIRSLTRSCRQCVTASADTKSRCSNPTPADKRRLR